MKLRSFALLLGSLITVGSDAQEPPSANPARQVHSFGLGAPRGLDELPPGRTTERIRSLPPAAQRRALDWMGRFSFPAADLEKIRADDQGGLYYRDDARLPEPAAEVSEEPPVPSGAMSVEDAFSLHSRPGASNVVYLDFDGHVVSGTAWNGGGGALYARPYDTDGTAAAFGQAELDSIAAIWHRVAEDLAPFDVDVTTQEPASFTATTAHILITRDDDENGAPMPSAGGGGVAYINVWGRTGTYDYQYYSPALVYYDNLGGGQARYVAEAAAHELGHNLALSHDGTSSVSYYSGHNAGPSGGYIDWAPIMGNSYGADVSQWSRGDYADANNQQDDLAEIASRLGDRFDDHGDTQSAATPLTVDGSGNVASTNPELDPFNDFAHNKGVIEHSSDVDYFVLNLGSGLVDVTVRPAWDAYYHEASRGANLDIHAALHDASGGLVAENDPATETHSQLVANVSAGAYFLVITGVAAGDPVTSYDEYASLGQYFIYGTVPVGSTNAAPNAVNDVGTVAEDGAVVLAVLANDTDPEGSALSIVSTTPPVNGAAIVNGSSITYTPDPNFNGDDAFGYSISDGLSTASATVNIAVSPVNDAPLAVNDGVTTAAAVAVSVGVLANDHDADGDALTISSTTQPANGSVSASAAAVTFTPDAGFVGTTSFQYSISDGAGGTDTASVTVVVEQVVVLPDAPTSVTALDSTTGVANVAWSQSPGADGYEVRREKRHKKRNTWDGMTTVGSTGSNTMYLDDASGSGTFRYQVRAFNDAGTSQWSSQPVVVTVTNSSGGGGGGGGKGRRK